jgi:hypothetical protein
VGRVYEVPMKTKTATYAETSRHLLPERQNYTLNSQEEGLGVCVPVNVMEVLEEARNIRENLM